MGGILRDQETKRPRDQRPTGPTADEELEIIKRTTADIDVKITPTLRAEDIAALTRIVRTVVGFGMVGVGTIWLVAAAGPFTISFGSIVLAAAAVAALALGVGPFVLRAIRQAAGERRERIRSEERAAVAAHDLGRKDGE